MPRTKLFGGREVLTHRYVDMWAFMGVHPCNLDFLKRLRMADDRQFAAGMDICGTVSEQDKETGAWSQSHLAAIRTDVWNPNRQQQLSKLESIQQDRREQLRRSIKSTGTLTGAQSARLNKDLERDPVMKLRADDLESRRLVMKLFRTTADRTRWVGTMEELTTREVHNSLGTNKPLLSLSSSLAGCQFMTHLQENHRTFRIPSLFTCSYFDEARQRMWYINVARKWISIGADFTVESEGRRVAEIDGALFGFGYNAHLYFYEPVLGKDTQFLDLITLFATTVGYQHLMRQAIRRRIKATRQGLAGQQIIEDDELKLLKNPRAA